MLDSMVILGHNRRNRRLFPLFPYLLIYRTEEIAGSNSSRSTCSQWLLLLSPPQERAADRLSLLHTAGTIRVQLGTIGNSLGTNILKHRDKFATK